MSKKDKVLLISMIGLIILLFIKSFVLDDYKPKNNLEEEFKAKVEQIVDEKYNTGLYEKNVISVRIVKISEMSEKERTRKDKDDNEYYASGVYKAKIRKYILGVLPFAEERILDIDLD